MDEPDIVATGTRLVYENRWLRLREDQVRRRDGSTGIYSVLEKPDFALVVARHADGALHLVEQYRYPVGLRLWEFPQGTWNGPAQGDIAALARTELREETGLDAGTLRHAGRFFHAAGYSTQSCHVFLATDLVQGPDAREDEEQDLRSRAFPQAEVERMLAEGVIQDSPSLAAFGLLRLRGWL